MEHAVGEVCTLCSGLPDCCWGSGPGRGTWGQRQKGIHIVLGGVLQAMVCVCVCLHLLVIGRGRERGGECPILALMK